MDPFRSGYGNQQGGGYNQGGADWRGSGGMNYNAQSPSGGQGYGNNWGRGGGQGGGQGGQGNSPPNRMYVGNLLYTAQPGDVTAFFEGAGFKVTNIQISMDPMTGRNPSYCFVDFDSAEEAQRAKNLLNGQQILGREVKINEGVHRRGNSNAQGLRVNPQSGYMGNQYGQTFSPTWNQGGFNSPQYHPRRLYIGGLPDPTSPHSSAEDKENARANAVQAIRNLVESHNFQVQEVYKLNDPLPSQIPDDSSDRHYIFVDLVNAHDVDAALDKLRDSPTPWGNGKMKVGRAKNNMNKRNQQGGAGGFQGGHQQAGYGGNQGYHQNQYGGY